MSLRMSSSVTSPVPMSLMPLLSSPRSPNCFMNGAPTPDGTNTNTASGLSVAHALQERREVRVLERHAQLVEHLAAVEPERDSEVLLGVDAGTEVGHQRHHLLDAGLPAQLASGLVTCGSVKPARTTNGDFSVITDVAAAITTIGVLLCVAIGAVASAAA